MRRDRQSDGLPEAAWYTLEAEMPDGLEGFVADELEARFGAQVRVLAEQSLEPGMLRFAYRGDLRALEELRCAGAVYLVEYFDVPRPRGLLGNEQMGRLLQRIELIRGLYPAEAFSSFYISAAGSDSSVMGRLRETLAERSGLSAGDERGDLWLRVRRPPDRGAGWEALLRLTPRPLSTRSWRVCNLEGALNATVAHAMLLLTHPHPLDFVLNIGCGSGTLLIERLQIEAARRIVGCDTSPAALECTRQNLEAAQLLEQVELQPWDARALPLADGSVDVLCADLPFGHLMGTHDQNLQLYPQLLKEAARVAADGAPFVLISHEIRLLEQLLEESSDWQVIEVIRVTLGGLHPRILLLQRNRQG